MTNASSTDASTGSPAPPAEEAARREAEEPREGEATSAAWAKRCANCGARLHGTYCHDCGEKVVGPEDYAFSGFLRRALATLTHLDGSVFRTYYYLFAKPGFLTAEHRAGRRKRYLKPLQVFVIANVAFYLFSVWTGANLLQTPLAVHLYSPAGTSALHTNLAEHLVGQHLRESGLAFETYAAQFNAWVGPLSKTLVLLMIPVFAGALKAVQCFERRHYVEHLVFSCHFHAFWLLLVILLGGFLQGFVPATLQLVGIAPPSFVGRGLPLAVALLCTTGAYFANASWRRFRQPWWQAVVQGVLLTAGFFFVLMLYRALLFFAAFCATT